MTNPKPTAAEQPSTRSELASDLHDFSDRVRGASLGGGTLREAMEAVQAAKDSLTEHLASMRAVGDERAPEYRRLQQALDRVIRAQAELEGAAKLTRTHGYV